MTNRYCLIPAGEHVMADAINLVYAVYYDDDAKLAELLERAPNKEQLASYAAFVAAQLIGVIDYCTNPAKGTELLDRMSGALNDEYVTQLTGVGI